MFKKNIDGQYILSNSDREFKWHAVTQEEVAEMANRCEAQGKGYEIRGTTLIKTQMDSEGELIELDCGVYRYYPSNYGSPEYLSPLEISDRNYPTYPEQLDQVDSELSWFKDNVDFFKDIGIRRSRSVLLWGPPGYSKTAKIHDICLKNKKDMIIIYMHLTPSPEMVTALNNIKQDKIIIFEEFATSVSNDTKIYNMLNFLDGDNSLDNAFFIITTNHPEAIPKNVLRPSRVDKFIKIDKLSTKDINNFLTFYLKKEVTPEEIGYMKNHSLADIREICISSLKEKLGLKEAQVLLKKRSDTLQADFANDRKLGIRNDFDVDY